MSRMLGNLTGDGWDEPAPSAPPSGKTRDLFTPPGPRFRGQWLLWALTLASFLGGTYYGFRFRKSTPPPEPHLTIVDDGASLVARWDARVAAFGKGTQLRITSEGKDRLVALDAAALQRGELPLDVSNESPVEVAWNAGWTGSAHYESGNPLEPGINSADAESLRLQIKDQRDLNSQMERRLARLKTRKP